MCHGETSTWGWTDVHALGNSDYETLEVNTAGFYSSTDSVQSNEIDPEPLLWAACATGAAELPAGERHPSAGGPEDMLPADDATGDAWTIHVEAGQKVALFVDAEPGDDNKGDGWPDPSPAPGSGEWLLRLPYVRQPYAAVLAGSAAPNFTGPYGRDAQPSP